jgi:hypothetical protein
MIQQQLCGKGVCGRRYYAERTVWSQRAHFEETVFDGSNFPAFGDFSEIEFIANTWHNVCVQHLLLTPPNREWLALAWNRYIHMYWYRGVFCGIHTGIHTSM